MGNVKPIPQGHHTVTPGLTIKGAAAAIEFYKKAFGAIDKGRMTDPSGKSIVHAELLIGDSYIFIGDESPDMGNKSPATLGGSPVALHIYTEDADAMFNRAVAAGAKVAMPLMDAFWGDRYGRVTDPFGHTWGIGTHKEDLTEAEIGKRAQAFYAEMAAKK